MTFEEYIEALPSSRREVRKIEVVLTARPCDRCGRILVDGDSFVLGDIFPGEPRWFVYHEPCAVALWAEEWRDAEKRRKARPTSWHRILSDEALL